MKGRDLPLHVLDYALRHTLGGWLLARWHARRVRRRYRVTPITAFRPITVEDIEAARPLDSIIREQIQRHVMENGTALPEVEALQDWLLATRADGFDMTVIDSLLAVSSLPDGTPASVLSLPADATAEGCRPLCLCQCGHVYAEECGCLYYQLLIPADERRPIWPDAMKITARS